MNSEPREKRSSAPWVAISMVTGATFGIIALLNAPGIAYVIVAGLAYSLLTMYNRRRLLS
jgi:hypothetical protein